MLVTPSPVEYTMPTPSWPGTNGGVGVTGQSPWAAWMSVWHRPDASIRMATWPGRGPGIGRSSMTSGWPNARTTAAFMMVLLQGFAGAGRGPRKPDPARPEGRAGSGQWSGVDGAGVHRLGQALGGG